MSATTGRIPGTARDALMRGVHALPLIVVALVLLSTGAAILPARSLVSFGPVELTLGRLLLLAGIAALLIAPGDGSPRRRVLLRTGLEIPLAVLLIVSLVATLKWGTEARVRFLVEAVALFYLAFAVARRSPEERRALTWVALVALALSALAGIAQVSQAAPTGFYRQGCVPVTLAPPAKPPDSLTRAIGTFANPNVLAGHLLLLAPLAALAVGLAPRVRATRLALALVVVLGAVALVLTLSRSAVLAAVLAAALGALAVGGRRGRTIALASVALGAIAVVLLAGCGGGGASTASFGRTLLWDQTMSVVADNPVTGVGLGRLGDVLRARDPRQNAPHAHNLFLTWWAEAGTAALIAWLAIFAVVLWRTFAATRRGDPPARAAFVALAAFALYSLLDHPANVDRVAAAFWIVAALGLAAAAAARARPDGAPDEPAPAGQRG